MESRESRCRAGTAQIISREGAFIAATETLRGARQSIRPRKWLRLWAMGGRGPLWEAIGIAGRLGSGAGASESRAGAITSGAGPSRPGQPDGLGPPLRNPARRSPARAAYVVKPGCKANRQRPLSRWQNTPGRTQMHSRIFTHDFKDVSSR